MPNEGERPLDWARRRIRSPLVGGAQAGLRSGSTALVPSAVKYLLEAGITLYRGSENVILTSVILKGTSLCTKEAGTVILTGRVPYHRREIFVEVFHLRCLLKPVGKEWGYENHINWLEIARISEPSTELPMGSMDGKFTYIYHKNQPNVGKYTIHRFYFLLALPFLLGQSTGTVNSHIMAGQPTPRNSRPQLLTTWFSLEAGCSTQLFHWGGHGLGEYTLTSSHELLNMLDLN